MEPPSSALTRGGSTSHYAGDTLTYLPNGPTDTYQDGAPISVVFPANSDEVVITGTTSNSDIGRIDVRPQGANPPVKWMSIGSIVHGTGLPANPGGRHWEGIQDSRGNIYLTAHISGDLTNNILLDQTGSKLYVAWVEGQTEQDVIARSGPFRFVTGSVALGADLVCQTGSIQEVHVTDGDLLAGVRAPNGSIERIDVESGDLGHRDAAALIEAGGVGPSGYHLKDLIVSGSVGAHIDANVSTGAVDGTVRTIEIGGDLGIHSGTGGGLGSLRLGDFVDFNVGGAFRTTMTMGNALALDRQLRVGLSLISYATIHLLPSEGLQGQVIFNTTSAAGQVWNGDVKIGPEGPNQVVLGDLDAGYVETAASLGGGSIGVTPFWLHDESCDPPNRAELSYDHGFGLYSIRLRHYGPVRSLGPVPVRVFRRPVCTEDAFVELSSFLFQFDEDPSDPNSLIVSFESGQPFAKYFEYLIELPSDPEEQVLVCDDVDDVNGGPPPVDWTDDLPIEDDYKVTVLHSCAGDFNDNNMVDVVDLLTLLGNFGGSGAGNGDTDCDGTIGILDLLAVLGAWGGCQPQVPDPPSIEEAVDAAGLTWQQWEDAIADLQDSNVSQAEKENLVCWWEHYLECHPDPFCVDCACQICPDDDPYGNH